MLGEILGSEAEARVWGVVLFEDGLHLREIARRANVLPNEAKRELDRLRSVGVLDAERRGNQLSFRAREGCPFLPELRGLYMKTEGVAPALGEALSPLSGVKYSFIFGSAALGRHRKGSDIDLMAIGDAEEGKVAAAVMEVQRKTGREINFILWSEGDFRRKAGEGSAFLKSVLKNKRIWLGGDEREFVRAAGEGARKKGR